jgi:hypothetical protein
MTKKEAIEWLKSLNYCDGEETQEVAQAFDMAINALEQPTSDDCVSREQAIKTIGTDIQLNLEGRSGLLKYSDEIKDILKALLDSQEKKLKALPPVIPTRKVGTWINSVYSVGFTCTCCSLTQTSGFKYDFCPNCGAEMRGSENG